MKVHQKKIIIISIIAMSVCYLISAILSRAPGLQKRIYVTENLEEVIRNEDDSTTFHKVFPNLKQTSLSVSSVAADIYIVPSSNDEVAISVIKKSPYCALSLANHNGNITHKLWPEK